MGPRPPTIAAKESRNRDYQWQGAQNTCFASLSPGKPHCSLTTCSHAHALHQCSTSVYLYGARSSFNNPRDAVPYPTRVCHEVHCVASPAGGVVECCLARESTPGIFGELFYVTGSETRASHSPQVAILYHGGFGFRN